MPTLSKIDVYELTTCCFCPQHSASGVSVCCNAFAASAREPQMAFLPRNAILRHSGTSQFKPIGGEGNGVIERKDVMHWMLSWCFEPCKLYSNSLLYNNSPVLVEQSGVDARIKSWCWGKSSSPDTQGVARGLHS
jgi:hypothetical protein